MLFCLPHNVEAEVSAPKFTKAKSLFNFSSHYYFTLSTFCKVHVQALTNFYFVLNFVSRIEVVKTVTSLSSLGGSMFNYLASEAPLFFFGTNINA